MSATHTERLLKVILAPVVSEKSTRVADKLNQVVFRVVSITPANEADLPSQAEQIAEQLLEQKRTTAFEVFRQNLKQQLLRSGELKLNETAMKNFLATFKNQ